MERLAGLEARMARPAKTAYELLCSLERRKFCIATSVFALSEDQLVDLFQQPNVFDTAQWAEPYIRAAADGAPFIRVPSIDWLLDLLYCLPQRALAAASTTLLKHAKAQFVTYMHHSLRTWLSHSGWSLMNSTDHDDHCGLLVSIRCDSEHSSTGRVHIATRDWAALLHWMATTPTGETVQRGFWEACARKFEATPGDDTCRATIMPQHAFRVFQSPEDPEDPEGSDVREGLEDQEEVKISADENSASEWYLHRGVLATSPDMAVLQSACAVLGSVKGFWHWHRRRRVLRKGQLARKLVNASADKMEALMKKRRLRAMMTQCSWEHDIVPLARDYTRYLELEAAAFALQREFLQTLPRGLQQARQQHVARGLRALLRVQDFDNTLLRAGLQAHSGLFNAKPVPISLQPLMSLEGLSLS